MRPGTLITSVFFNARNRPQARFGDHSLFSEAYRETSTLSPTIDERGAARYNLPCLNDIAKAANIC